MKTFFIKGLILAYLFLPLLSYSQLIKPPKFDYAKMKEKTLYIPTFEVSEKYIKKMERKGKFDKIETAEKKAELWNKNWKLGIEESKYNMTKYEIKAFDSKALIKSKNPDVLILRIFSQKQGSGNSGITAYNTFAGIQSVGPKKAIMLTQIPINGFDLSDKNEIRLIMNMLIDGIEMAVDAAADGDATYKEMRVEAKKQFIAYSEKMKDMTFLVPEVKSDKGKGDIIKRTEEVKKALKSWSISKFKMSNEEEINQFRLEGNKDYYYWKVIPYYVSGIPFVYNLYYVISCHGDEIVFMFIGPKKLDGKTIEKAHKKYQTKLEKFKKQVAGK